MRIIRQKKADGGLQFRMTVFITAVVLVVSSVVMVVLAHIVTEDCERILQERLSDDITAISRIMEQRLLRIEGSTNMVAALVKESLSCKEDIDTLLQRGLESMDNVYGVAIVFEKGWLPGTEGYCELYAWNSNAGTRLSGMYINGDELEDDEDWIESYVNGNSSWSEIKNYDLGREDIICYYCPLYGPECTRIGMVYSAVFLDYLTSFVTEYKTRTDIDISIYNSAGEMIVAPDEYIRELSPENLVTMENTIDNIGWKVILSADRKIIDKVVGRTLVGMSLIFALMFIVVSLVIRLTVRYVAKPYIEEQQRIQREKAVIENEMRLASKAQNELVPHIFPPFPERQDIDISACLHPARSVGGDLYDYFLSNDLLYFCIGDVSGKGLQGSLFMAATHYLFRSTAAAMPLADAARQINISLCADNEQCRFVTLWLGCLDLGTGELEYVNAGHDSPLLVRGGKTEFLQISENMPMGVLDQAEFVPGKLKLLPGDTLFLYTDGITEAMNARNEEFGKDRLFEAVSALPAESAGDLIERVLNSIRQHSSETEQSDDITMLSLRLNDNKTINS